MNPRAEAVYLGTVLNDSGLLMLLDPCYIRNALGEAAKTQDAKEIYTWLCDQIDNKKSTSLRFAFGHEGLGVIFSAHGERGIPVYAIYEDGDLARIELRYKEEVNG